MWIDLAEILAEGSAFVFPLEKERKSLFAVVHTLVGTNYRI
jgi:hypothetical protein